MSIKETTNIASLGHEIHLGDEDYKDFKPDFRVWVAFATICVLTLMVALDGTSISVALPPIAHDLRGTAIEAFWSGTSFLLCSTVFQPSFASFSNIFGRKLLIVIAVHFFFVGSLVASISKNFTHMLVGRSIQGVGGGGLIALAEIVVTDIVPLRLRGKYFGILAAMWSIGSVTGPILGGGFSQNVTWRWIFYINFPFIGVGLVFVLIFLKLSFTRTSLRAKLRRIDYLGTVLFVGSTTSFLIPITWGGVMYAWSSWRTLAPMVIGVIGLVVFMLYETYIAPEPLIPIPIFSSRTAIVAYIGATLHGLVLWCVLYYMPLYFEAVREYGPIMSGVALFPETFTVAPTAIIIGILITTTGRYQWSIYLGWVFSTVGMGLFCVITTNTSVPSWIFLMLVSGIGLGILFQALGYAIQASAKPGYIANAAAMFSFFRAFGQAIGVAIGGVIFQNRMRDNLMAYSTLAPLAEEYSKNVAGLVEIIKAMPDSGDKQNLKQAYTDSLRIVWAVCCALMGLGGLLSLFSKEYDINRAVNTDQGIMRKETCKEDGKGPV